MTSTQVRAGTDAARAFRRRIVAATVLPWVVVVAAHHAGVTADSGLLAVAGLIAAAHVGTTLQFYADPGLNLPRKDPVRYVIVPVALVGGAVIAFAASGAMRTGLLLVLQLWQIHHFTRQNLGVFSLYARARGGGSLSARERRLFDFTSYAGMCGTVGLVVDVPVRPLGVLFLAAAVVVLWLERPEPWRMVALAAAIAFYLPLFLYSPSLEVAVAAYAFAHGAQYLVMVNLVRVRSAWLTVTAGAVYGVALWTGTGVAVFTGVTLAHFVIDAGIWKMRDPDQRKWLTSRLTWMAPAGQAAS